MNAHLFCTAGRRLQWLAPWLALVLLSGVAQAGDLYRIPEEVPGPPIYARGMTSLDCEWSVTVFYRAPKNVPADFNLLDFFDFNLLDPEYVKDHPLLMEGFGIWEEGVDPSSGYPPTIEVLRNVRGVRLPIWLIQTTEVIAGEDDGVLTVGELKRMRSCLKGWAHSYYEVIWEQSFEAVICGVLEDGRSFQVLAIGDQEGWRRLSVRIGRK